VRKAADYRTFYFAYTVCLGMYVRCIKFDFKAGKGHFKLPAINGVLQLKKKKIKIKMGFAHG